MTFQHLVALGDSIAAGTGDPVDGVAHLSFIDHFADALRAACAPAMRYSNFARHGATLDDIVAVQLPAALDLEPDIVVLSGGGNDVLQFQWSFDGVRDQLEEMLLAFSPDTLLITFTYVDVVAVLGDDTSPWVRRVRRRLDRLNGAIRELSTAYDTIFVDYWDNSLGITADCWSEDGIHPNALGHLRAVRPLIAAFSAKTGLVLPVPTERALIRHSW